MSNVKEIENRKVFFKNAEIRGVEILKTIPLHLETVQEPIVKSLEARKT